MLGMMKNLKLIIH